MTFLTDVPADRYYAGDENGWLESDDDNDDDLFCFSFSPVTREEEVSSSTRGENILDHGFEPEFLLFNNMHFSIQSNTFFRKNTSFPHFLIFTFVIFVFFFVEKYKTVSKAKKCF